MDSNDWFKKWLDTIPEKQRNLFLERISKHSEFDVSEYVKMHKKGNDMKKTDGYKGISEEHAEEIFREMNLNHWNDNFKIPDMNYVNHNNLTKMSAEIFEQNKEVGWWAESDMALLEEKGKGFITLVSSKLCLVHSEISEALEGIRKGLKDDHLKARDMIEVELADAIIRILDIAGYMNLDIGEALAEKIEYNKNRKDHKLENRKKEGGKII